MLDLRSALLGSGVCAALLLLAACVRHFGRRADEPERKVKALTWGFALAGPLFGWFAYAMDAEQRRVTLYEVELECAPDGNGWVGFQVDVEVLHPGGRHVLMATPRPATFDSADGPCDVAVRWIEPAGTLLLEERESLRAHWSNRRAVRKVWDGASWRFTPRSAGLHRLEVEALHPGVRELFIRVEDPTGPGQPRAEGY